MKIEYTPTTNVFKFTHTQKKCGRLSKLQTVMAGSSGEYPSDDRYYAAAKLSWLLKEETVAGVLTAEEAERIMQIVRGTIRRTKRKRPSRIMRMLKALRS